MSKITITGGVACGRRIASVPHRVRPTPARLRRALFDILGDIEDKSFFDLFAGSGAVGIEAMSRAAEPVVFVEIDGRNRRIIEKNIANVGLQEIEHKIVCTDALRFLKKIDPEGEAIVFASPPYMEKFLKKVLMSMIEFAKLKAGSGIVSVLQFPKRSLPQKFEFPPSRIHTIGDDTLVWWE